MNQPFIDYIIKNRDICEKTGCWNWLRARSSSGYGNAYFMGLVTGAHRASYMAFKGPFDNKLHVCHKCDNKGCVNPEHLFLGTQHDNAMDTKNKGRFNHVRGEACSWSKLTEERVKRIRDLYKNKRYSSNALARMYRVSRICISSIVNYKRWTHI